MKEFNDNLQEKMLLAICKPADRVAVPYKKATFNKKVSLHEWKIDPKKAARNATVVALEAQLEVLKALKSQDLDVLLGDITTQLEKLRTE